jgi:hypothetical protein
MVAAVGQIAAGFLKHYVHIRDCPFIELRHVTRPVNYRGQSIGMNRNCRRSISSRSLSAIVSRPHRQTGSDRPLAYPDRPAVEYFRRTPKGAHPSSVRNSFSSPQQYPERIYHINYLRPAPRRSKQRARQAFLDPRRHQLQKNAFRRLSRIANATGVKRVITKKAIVTPPDGFLSRWTRIEQHSSCGSFLDNKTWLSPFQQRDSNARSTAARLGAPRSSAEILMAVWRLKVELRRGRRVPPFKSVLRLSAERVQAWTILRHAPR